MFWAPLPITNPRIRLSRQSPMRIATSTLFFIHELFKIGYCLTAAETIAYFGPEVNWLEADHHGLGEAARKMHPVVSGSSREGESEDPSPSAIEGKQADALPVSALTQMVAIRTVVELIVDLSGILAGKPEVVGNFLQGSPVLDHHVKTLERIRAILFFKLPLELICRSDVELVSPVRNRRGANI